YNKSSLIIKMNDYGDLPLTVLFTSQQIIIETYICPANTIRDTAEFNVFLLRNQKVLPLSSVGITRVKQEEYYVTFGALSLNSSLDDVTLEITTLIENALDVVEITQDYLQE
ncbi:TPA: YjfI family protein, partial [Salmonella enterica subsp. diarizonae serovar 61:z52-z57:-]